MHTKVGYVPILMLCALCVSVVPPVLPKTQLRVFCTIVFIAQVLDSEDANPSRMD